MRVTAGWERIQTLSILATEHEKRPLSSAVFHINLIGVVAYPANR
jgi:hypothetical protein